MVKMANFTLWIFYHNKVFTTEFQTPCGFPDLFLHVNKITDSKTRTHIQESPYVHIHIALVRISRNGPIKDNSGIICKKIREMRRKKLLDLWAINLEKGYQFLSLLPPSPLLLTSLSPTGDPGEGFIKFG